MVLVQLQSVLEQVVFKMHILMLMLGLLVILSQSQNAICVRSNLKSLWGADGDSDDRDSSEEDSASAAQPPSQSQPINIKPKLFEKFDKSSSGAAVGSRSRGGVGVPCGDGSYVRRTYMSEDNGNGGAGKILCGIKHGHNCPAGGRGENACAGAAQCLSFWNRKTEEDENVCTCTPQSPARIDQICSPLNGKFNSSLFFTLRIRPVLSGIQGDDFLHFLNQVAIRFNLLESFMEYAEPQGEGKACPVLLSRKVENALEYWLKAEYLNPLEHPMQLVRIEGLLKELEARNGPNYERLCDYRYPLTCSEEGFCILRTNDVFIKSVSLGIKSESGKAPTRQTQGVLKNMKTWEMAFGEGEVCNDLSGIHPDLPRIYKWSVSYESCTPGFVCKDSGMSNAPFEQEGLENMKTCQPGENGGTNDTETEPPPTSPTMSTAPTRLTTLDNRFANLCKGDENQTLKDIATLNQRRLRESKLGWGDECDHAAVKGLQKALKLNDVPIRPQNNQKFSATEKVQICLEMKALDPGWKNMEFCDPHRLLQCGEEKVCTCFKDFEVPNDHDDFKEMTKGLDTCLLAEKMLCGESWVLDETGEIWSLPKEPPVCASLFCEKFEIGTDGYLEHQCEENPFGLLMIKVNTKDLEGTPGQGSGSGSGSGVGIIESKSKVFGILSTLIMLIHVYYILN